ncbi:antibiotic biosynthesis monooxygenase [Saccharopolyspora sp. HNM0983]|uniref:Antibiotic biosynthesis monooxygenase n=1 Tax=Saccharopolyspora montiporae TaxID=2781240 RepID=A0A929BEM5_9PSEU|nr:antibiotic biosynthesis monooxygenase [Saccharopolyspora sp. HNM0983]
MIIINNELWVAEQYREQFEQTFAESMHQTLRGVPGLRRATLLAPREEGRGYLATLEFDDQPSYEAYLQSDAFRAAHPWPGRVPLEGNALATYEVHTEMVDPDQH